MDVKTVFTILAAISAIIAIGHFYADIITPPTPINYPPAAFIDYINPSPALQGQSVRFTCHGDDPDSGDHITEYKWESSIDGFLSDQKTFSTSSLSSGSHQISLRVKDRHGQWSSGITRNIEVEAIKIPSAEIKNIWVDFNVFEDNSKGMRIHVSFDIYNLKDEDCGASAYFFIKSGVALRDYNQRYCSRDGQVRSGAGFKPSNVINTFDDLCIFMPYDELHMLPGKHDLKFRVLIWHENTELDRSDWVYFFSGGY